MSEYIKYQHVEKFANTKEVDGILSGVVYVFPKIDGTNAQIWYDEHGVHYGSRNRELSLDKDNSGFMQWAIQQKSLDRLARNFKGCRIFGEWLVPHTLKTYMEDAWRKFYVFDIYNSDTQSHLKYDDYKPILDQLNIDYIEPLSVYKNPNMERLYNCLEKNDFLIKDGEGTGEGVVCKNYQYKNIFGRQTWAKIVRSDFKSMHRKNSPINVIEGNDFIEERIVKEFLTDDIIEKVFANIVNQNNGDWQGRFIPQLLSTVYYDFINECTWVFLKKLKNPTIDFKMLNRFCIERIKELKSELF